MQPKPPRQKLPRHKLIRSAFVRWVARKLGVPVAVHQAFFMSGTKAKMSLSATCPITHPPL